MLKAAGGKNIFGFFIGMLMLETKFPRIPGDMGNTTPWNFPVPYSHCADMTSEGVDFLNSGAVENVIAYLNGSP